MWIKLISQPAFKDEMLCGASSSGFKLICLLQNMDPLPVNAIHSHSCDQYASDNVCYLPNRNQQTHKLAASLIEMLNPDLRRPELNKEWYALNPHPD